MKSKHLVIVSGVSLAVVGLASRALSDDQTKSQEPTAEQTAAMPAEWAKIAAPSVHHKRLDFFVGKWRTKTKMWMGGPGSMPIESDGTSEIKWVFGGRYLLDEHKGSMMGQPYEGMGLTGYDNYRNMYVGSWYSNMGTAPLTMTGMRHPKTGVFTYYGEMDEPALKVTGRTVKYVVRPVDKDHYVFEIIDLHAGDGYKVIEITYTRM